MSPDLDAVVVGAGPNGLAAAVELARRGLRVRVLEARATIGGGTRTAECTLPGFRHDLCSAVHPMGILSPFFRSLGLEREGLEWIQAPASVAHPLDDGPAAILRRDIEATGATLDGDAAAWARLVRPFLGNPLRLFGDLLGPLRLPRGPLDLARFGLVGLSSARWLVERRFRHERAKALFAGCAAHSILPLERPLTAAVGLVFALAAHVEDWPVARGGSQAIGTALARRLAALGGEVECARPVHSLADVPPSRAVLFDLAPRQVLAIVGDALPAGYRARLERYRYGPAAFKVDWALDGPIPWRDPTCAEASTVHVGGTFAEIAAAEAAPWRGQHAERPFVLVTQQSHFDPTRAPAGRHTGYAYCHVPSGSTEDQTAAIESQIERFAPGFRELVLARHVRGPAQIEADNAACIGGAITGGAADWRQLFTRPDARLDPYSTPNPRLWLCSHATPPGGGVHGMCGYFAARSVIRRLRG